MMHFRNTFSLSFMAVLCCTAFPVGLLIAAQPDVQLVQPPGIVRGVPTVVTFRGARLGDVKEILFYQSGIDVSQIEVLDDNSFKATLLASEDYPCELQAFRVCTASGLSNLRLLGVGHLPIVDEVEPNSDFSAPQLIQNNCTIHGVIRTEDVDYFAVNLKKGERLNVELEGLRLSHMYDFFDPFVAILNEERFEIARSDDHAFVQQDCICSVIAPEDGRYLIEVRDSSFGGNDRAQYRLHVGDFPRPVATFPLGGQAGEQLTVTCIDDLGQRWEEQVQLPDTVGSSVSSYFKNWSRAEGKLAPSPNVLRVSAMPNFFESESNDEATEGLPIAEQLPVAFNGILEKEDDVDWFAFRATKDQQIEVRCIARKNCRSPVDAVIVVRKIGGAQIGQNDDSGGPDAFLSVKIPEDGVYAVSMRDHLGRGGPTFVYRIEVSTPVVEIATSVNELERWVAQTVVVPQGARMAVMANLVRRNVGGAGTLSIPDLPSGTHFPELAVAADAATVPIMIRADADAPIGANLVDLQAQLPISQDRTLIGHFEQRNMILRGQNNVDVWGHDSDRMALSVAEAVPFDIIVEQPKVPIVRDGSLTLKVRADRKEGFTKPIDLRLLYAPPGVAASASVTIPENATEALIPVTANGGAAIGVWPITVLASTDLGRGRIQIASEFIHLDVQDSLFEFQFNKAVTEQGQPVDIFVGAKSKRAVEGDIVFELHGIPPGTNLATPQVKWSEGTETLTFRLEVPTETRQGNFKTLVCRAIVRSELGEILQTNGTGEVQIDVPLPAPTVEVAAAPVQAPPEQPPAERPLTRLEQLKKMREAARTGKND